MLGHHEQGTDGHGKGRQRGYKAETAQKDLKLDNEPALAGQLGCHGLHGALVQLQDLAARRAEQMVVMPEGVTGHIGFLAVWELDSFEEPGLAKELQGAKDRGTPHVGRHPSDSLQKLPSRKRPGHGGDEVQDLLTWLRYRDAQASGPLQ